MSKYDFDCPICGPIEIIHIMNEDHPDTCPNCASKIKRSFKRTKGARIIFKSSRGGGVDDWASKQAPRPQNPTHPEKDVPYR